MTQKNYSFGACADRLIQIDLRGDGSVRVIARQIDKTGTMQTIAAKSLTDFTAAQDPNSHMTLAVAVDQGSWGTMAVQNEEWQVTYDDDNVSVLGMPNPAANRTSAFGSDLAWGGGTRVGNAVGNTVKKLSFDRFGVLSFGASDGSGCWNYTRNVVNAPSAPGTPGTDRRTAVVLRLAPGNTGRVTITNIDTGASGVWECVFS